MKAFGLVLVMMLLMAMLVMPGVRPPSSAANKVTPDTLRQMEGEFMKAAAEHGSAGYMSYYADDSVELPNGADAIQGKANIAKGMDFLDDKNNHLIWTPVGADVSASGDLGYTYGTF
ncbi:MAG: hypothetical protein WBZ11_03350 [Candidatus Sulfotelmatobacter sp.]